MSPFAAAALELARILDRLAARCRLFLARRTLARLETNLGLLGWQQADYDAPAQEQVSRISEYERDQAGLTNESAALAITIRDIAEIRDREKAESDRLQAEIQAELEKLARPLEAVERQLALDRKARAICEKEVAGLENERSEIRRDYDEASADIAQTAENRAALMRIQERSKAVHLKLREAHERLDGLKGKIAQAETTLRRERPPVESLEQRLRQERTRFDGRDSSLGKEIAGKEREKRDIEKRINALEHAKSNPYREIGRVLGDCGIAPMNQPQALEAVLEQRLRASALESMIAASFEQSRTQPPALLRKSLLWWLLCLAILFGLAVLLSRLR